MSLFHRRPGRRVPSLVARIAFALAPAVAAAQSGSIAGTVKDQTSQQPLSDVRIAVAGTTLGTLSNQQGEFRLATVRAGRVIVTAMRIGYKPSVDTVNILAGQTATIAFNMTESLVNLSEVVVTGTAGNQERKAQAALVASLQTADVLKDAPVTSVANLLQSRVPGVALNA
ncbi:MAG: carboxypeptidase-like regulatory domain-containing protein, partial [Gemmatimonadota bacterium]|nr:carboxypeptidase-like regulatory domain-containing protein [Gemmatimonadota bacterium]